MLGLAELLRTRGEFAEAEALGKRVLTRCAVMGSEADPSREFALRELAGTYLAQGKIIEAQALYSDWRVPPTLDVERWIEGSASPPGGRPTVVVVFELWCPFSQQVFPELQRTFEAYGARGLGVVGLTRLSGNTEEEVRAFIREKGITFPSAVGIKSLYDDFRVTGIPMAILLRQDRVVWHGHAGGLTHTILDGLVGRAAPARPRSAG